MRTFPVAVSHPIPQEGEPGAFGAVRKYDIHTGIDLYTIPNEVVQVVEDGIIVAIEHFTGEDAGSPWWNDTWAILVESKSGVICYGEILPYAHFRVGMNVLCGEKLGMVIPVLKTYKGVNPTTMLHFELYTHGTRSTVWWHHGQPQPLNLLDPTPMIRSLYPDFFA